MLGNEHAILEGRVSCGSPAGQQQGEGADPGALMHEGLDVGHVLLVLQGGPSLANDPADLLKYLGLDVGVLNEVAEGVFEVGCGGVRA